MNVCTERQILGNEPYKQQKSKYCVCVNNQGWSYNVLTLERLSGSLHKFFNRIAGQVPSGMFSLTVGTCIETPRRDNRKRHSESEDAWMDGGTIFLYNHLYTLTVVPNPASKDQYWSVDQLLPGHTASQSKKKKNLFFCTNY